MTRDNRIGEITNAATSIENRYTTNEDIKELYSNYSSLLRIFQGKEIDFLKTGYRWHMNNGLRKHLKQLPYFLLYNYPAKLKAYNSLVKKNKQQENKEDKLKLNAYHSPSPMNELCDYICTWEKKKIVWDRDINSLANIRELIINNSLDLSDKSKIRLCRKYINQYAIELKKHLDLYKENLNNKNNKFNIDAIIELFKNRLANELKINEELIANYVIKTSYASVSISKSLSWSAYGNYIIKNLKNNTNPKRNISMKEVPYKTNHSQEYLGKYYEIEEGDTYI